jgi:hypothetical protein
VRAHRVPGDQHAICVQVAATSPGYRLRVVDGAPHSTEDTLTKYTVSPARFSPATRSTTASSPLRQTAEPETFRRLKVRHHRIANALEQFGPQPLTDGG